MFISSHYQNHFSWEIQYKKTDFLFNILIILFCFYRVAVQNERYDEWSNILVELRRLFTDYQQSVLEYNNRPDTVIPKAQNSTAAQGNFLEVLNMSLNGNSNLKFDWFKKLN